MDTQLKGHTTVTRSLTVGARTSLKGEVTVGANLNVRGWLDAPNIKTPCKGLFASEADLVKAYPSPRQGWWALVGDSIPAEIFYCRDREWMDTGRQGGETVVDLNYYDQALDDTRDEIGTATDRITALEEATHLHPVEVADTASAELVIVDDALSPLLTVKDGHVHTRCFDSSAIPAQIESALAGFAPIIGGSGSSTTVTTVHPVAVQDTDTADLVIADADGTALLTISGGNIYTRGWNSAAFAPPTVGTTISGTAQAVALSLKLLAIGNSFSADCLSYLPMVLESLLPSIDVTLGIACVGGCTLQQHVAHANSGAAAYTFHSYTTSAGRWTTTESRTLSQILMAERWEIITMQQQSGNSPDYSTYQPHLTNLISWISTMVTWPVRLGWLLTPALVSGTGNLSSDEMYEHIAAASRSVVADTPIDLVLPCGAAIQKARHTELASYGAYAEKGMSYEGLHLQEGIGPLCAAYAAALALMKHMGQHKGILCEGTRPDAAWLTAHNIPEQHGPCVGITDGNALIAQQCAIAANK